MATRFWVFLSGAAPLDLLSEHLAPQDAHPITHGRPYLVASSIAPGAAGLIRVELEGGTPQRTEAVHLHPSAIAMVYEGVKGSAPGFLPTAADQSP